MAVLWAQTEPGHSKHGGFQFSLNYSAVLEPSWKISQTRHRQLCSCDQIGRCDQIGNIVLVYENNKCVRHVSTRDGFSLFSQTLACTTLNPNIQNVLEKHLNASTSLVLTCTWVCLGDRRKLQAGAAERSQKRNADFLFAELY